MCLLANREQAMNVLATHQYLIALSQPPYWIGTTIMSSAVNELIEVLLVRCYCFKTILRKEAQFSIHKTP